MASCVAAELAAARRTREAALEDERAGLLESLAAAEKEVEAAAATAAERREARAAAEATHEAADRGRRATADALAAVRAEAASLAQRATALEQGLADTRRRLQEAEAALTDLARRRERLATEAEAARVSRRCDPAELARLEAEVAAAGDAAREAKAELARREAEAVALERALQVAEAATAAARERVIVAQAERSHAESALAAAVAAVEDRLQRSPEALLAEEGMAEAVASARIADLEAQLQKLRATRERIGPVNLRAEIEVAELEAAIGETKERQVELQQAIDRLRAAIATLNKEGRERLLQAFAAVDGHFRRLFTTLFGGGKAHLRLTGADDPLQAGLELEASPPGKKLTSISLLSGGEKTLTALALVFGFFLAQPSPLCVLDEVDAPLDDANVDRFVSLMQEIAATTGTRFLVVTHHPLTMARMSRLYGVTMAERGISRLVSVALEEALELRATA